MSNLILIGFKASGKTTLGRKIAAYLKKPFLDTDDCLEEPPSILHKKLGEEGFRAYEKSLLSSLCAVSNSVIATGGGVPLDPENRILLQKMGTIIHLCTSKEIIEQRIGVDHPFLSDYDMRLGIYNSIAHHRAHTEEELWEVIRSDLYSG